MKAETTTVLLPVTLLEAGADKDIELESTLADYLPNINRIIKADADLSCEDIQINGNKAEVSGKAVFTLLYESDFKQKLRRERFSTDFVQRFELRDLPEGELLPHATVKCSYVGCKTLNPRRFILRCRADIGLTVKCMKNAQVVAMEDCKGAFFKSQSLTVAVYCPDIIRDFNTEETVSFETLPPIDEIIYSSVDFSVPEISQGEGNTLLRGEATLKCLYESEDENAPLQILSRRFPYAFTVEDESINQDSDISAKLILKSIETEKDIDSYGENRVVQIKYGTRVCIACVNRQETVVPTDMFFEEYSSENKPAELHYEEPVKDIRHRFVIDKVFDGNEYSLADCLDVNADINITETAIGEDGISIKGSCDVNVLGSDGNGYRSGDFNIPFSQLIPFSYSGKKCGIKACALPQNATAELTGGRLSVRVPTELSISLVYGEAITVLSSAEIEKREDSDKDEKPTVIYYPEKGESVWDIGKRYYVNPETIREDNADVFDKNGVVTENNTVIYM